MYISIDQLHASENRFKNWKKSPRAKTLPETQPVSVETKGTPLISPNANLEKRKEMLSKLHLEPTDFAFERTIGKNDSVYSNFCELIADAKRIVGRIVIMDGSQPMGYATGFMVSEQLLLTNWHVFKTKEEVKNSHVEFNYEFDVNGKAKDEIKFELEPETFFHSNQELDYCFVAVKQKSVDENIALKNIGYHFLDPTIGKLGDEGKELLNIIHHPSGDYKQLSIRENRFTKILDHTLWYETDTAQGSSGSPVFNDQWQVVALHHMGVPKRSKDGKHYLDKKGNIIQPVNGKIDVEQIQWIANEGIRISVILHDIMDAFPKHPVVEGLKLKPARNSPDDFRKEEEKDNHSTASNEMNKNAVNISIPVTMVTQTGKVSISISSGDVLTENNQPLVHDNLIEADEVKKVVREDALDLSDAHGYDPRFMGVHLPIPTPKKSLKKYVARLKGSNATQLDYYHYSVLFHTDRKMPIISAINVDGDPKKRKDISERKDDWLRDNRIDYELQLNDAYYAGSGFDKGHMSRREDANWAPTPALAKRYADITCMYTNACPQVHALNGSGGLWGQLEKEILEKGAEDETGKTGRIVVFNGPIFQTTDKTYKGIQVPMDFYKLIVWYNDNDELKATAFRLSQKNDVKGIDFEAIDINERVKFQEYQISIKSLEKITKLDFSKYYKYDTFSSKPGIESMAINTSELRTLIRKNNRSK